MKITAHKLDGEKSEYKLPLYRDVEKHIEQTHGSQFDPIDRCVYEGGIPVVWRKIGATNDKEIEV